MFGMLNKVFQKYQFKYARTPQPGVAYHTPLQQFQSWVDDTIQGPATLVTNAPRIVSRANVYVYNSAVNSGTSGVIQGQLFFQPLVITNPQNNASA